MTQLSAGQPFVFIPYPQFTSFNVLDSNDFSTYHALEAQLTRRFSNGISFNIAYTWSKALDTRSFDPDPHRGRHRQRLHRRRYAVRHQQPPTELRSTADFDRRHVLQWNFVAELPFGKGKHFLGNASRTAGSHRRRLGSDRLRPRHQRPALHGVLRVPTQSAT